MEVRSRSQTGRDQLIPERVVVPKLSEHHPPERSQSMTSIERRPISHRKTLPPIPNFSFDGNFHSPQPQVIKSTYSPRPEPKMITVNATTLRSRSSEDKPQIEMPTSPRIPPRSKPEEKLVPIIPVPKKPIPTPTVTPTPTPTPKEPVPKLTTRASTSKLPVIPTRPASVRTKPLNAVETLITLSAAPNLQNTTQTAPQNVQSTKSKPEEPKPLINVQSIKSKPEEPKPLVNESIAYRSVPSVYKQPVLVTNVPILGPPPRSLSKTSELIKMKPAQKETIIEEPKKEQAEVLSTSSKSRINGLSRRIPQPIAKRESDLSTQSEIVNPEPKKESFTAKFIPGFLRS